MNKKLTTIAIKILNKYKKTFKKLAEYEHAEKELCKQDAEVKTLDLPMRKDTTLNKDNKV